MEHPEERYYKLNRFFLSVSGLWPYQNAWEARLMRTIITIMMLSSVFVQLSSIFTSDITLDFLADMLPAFLTVLASLAHLHIRVIHADELRELFDRMWNDWALQKTEDELKIMHEHAEMTRLLTFYFSLQVYIFVVGYTMWLFIPEILDIISPMNESRPRMQPFKVEFFIDAERYFYVIRFHTYIVIFFLSIIFISCLALFLAATLHVCGMCKLLGYRAERLFCVMQDATKYDDLISGTKISCGKITVLTQLHYNVIQFVGIIEKYHTIPFILDLLCLVIALSLTLVQVLTISGDMDQAIRSIGLSTMQLSYIFIFNYMGQKITDVTTGVCEKVYNSAWYDAVITEQKSLLLIMKRRFRPLILTACKFYVMSLQNFETILHTTISYCMFFRQI